MRPRTPDEIVRYSTGEQILVGDKIRYPGFDSLGKVVDVVYPHSALAKEWPVHERSVLFSFGKEDQVSLVLYDTEHEEDLVFVSRAGLPVLQSEMADA